MPDQRTSNFLMAPPEGKPLQRGRTDGAHAFGAHAKRCSSIMGRFVRPPREQEASCAAGEGSERSDAGRLSPLGLRMSSSSSSPALSESFAFVWAWEGACWERATPYSVETDDASELRLRDETDASEAAGARGSGGWLAGAAAEEKRRETLRMRPFLVLLLVLSPLLSFFLGFSGVIKVVLSPVGAPLSGSAVRERVSSASDKRRSIQFPAPVRYCNHAETQQAGRRPGILSLRKAKTQMAKTRRVSQSVNRPPVRPREAPPKGCPEKSQILASKT
ncbi:hypothetical protein C8J57DRAFT_1566740 [Mycena rebaudengoi]|nr:hypothetical protein C8J57DRAFT_1566740 [Mycena rebaudengoi]